MLQQSLEHTWHPFKGNYRPLASTFTIMVFQWESGPKLILLSSQPDNSASPFCSSSATQDKTMHLGTHWALLVWRGQNPSHEGTAYGKDWEFSKFSSHKSSNLSHSVLQLLEGLLPRLAILHANPVAFLRNLPVLNIYGAATWSSVPFFAKYCILTTVSRLDGVFGKLFFGSGCF